MAIVWVCNIACFWQCDGTDRDIGYFLYSYIGVLIIASIADYIVCCIELFCLGGIPVITGKHRRKVS